MASIHAAPSRASISPGVRSGGITPAQFGDVDRERGVVLGGLLGLPQFLADLPGQVLGGGRELPGCRVVEHQRAELLAGVIIGRAEQAGDLVQPRLAPGVQADRQRVGRGIGAKPRGARGDDAFPEDGGFRGTLPDWVELFQGVDQRRERVTARTRPAGGRIRAITGSPFAGLVRPVRRIQKRFSGP